MGRHLPTRLTLAAVLIAVVAPTATAVARGSLTPAAYRAQANAVCKTTSARLKAITPATTPKQFAGFLKKALPVFEAQIASLAKLSPPARFRADHLKAIALERSQVVGIKRFIAAVAAGGDPTAEFKKTDAALSPLSKAETAIWKKLGLPACADL